jgi:hypothetical protein
LIRNDSYHFTCFDRGTPRRGAVVGEISILSLEKDQLQLPTRIGQIH